MTGDENLLFLLGYLNSKIATYLFSQIGSTSGVGTTRWQAFTMERLLIPRVTSELQSKVARLAERILAVKKDRPNASTLELETKLDEIVYHLYGLSDEEIEVVNYHH